MFACVLAILPATTVGTPTMDAVTAVKEIAGLVKKANDFPLYERIVGLQAQVVELAGRVLELNEENRALREKVELREKTSFRNPYYFEDGNEVPLCPNCFMQGA